MSPRKHLGWYVLAACTCAIILVPILSIVLNAWIQHDTPLSEFFSHSNLLVLGMNTIVLMSAVGLITGVLGSLSAWVTTFYTFPSSRLLDGLLLMPLAVPSYVMAFVYLGLIDDTGMPWLIYGIRSPLGVACVLSLSLYPYVYFIVKSALKTQGPRVFEAAQVLGLRPFQAFLKVSLPMAVPWIVGGILLVAMEVLGNFGAVSLFNYDTLTTGVYKAWFGFFSFSSALKLALLILALAFLLVGFQMLSERRKKFTALGTAPLSQRPITGIKKWMAIGFCWGLVALSFVLPVAQLSVWASESVGLGTTPQYIELLMNSLTLAVGGTIAVCVGCVCLCFANRWCGLPGTSLFKRSATLGYALPGTVLAVGLFSAISFMAHSSWISMGLTSSCIGLIWGYTCRFMVLAINPIDGALKRLPSRYEEASTILGIKGISQIIRIHFPIMRWGFVVAGVLVFVDIMRELPMTLMMRPFGWDTLSVRVFEMTSEGEWVRAALPALMLILLGLLPACFLVKVSRYES